jgi:UDP-N-acetylmuramoylalanine--D-glutamate ligase
MKQGYRVWLSERGQLREDYRRELTEHGIPFEEGGHDEKRILASDEVIKSPGIPPTAPLVGKIREAGIPVIGELEFAARYTDAKKVCITGSNGKTTTTLLTYHILRNAGLDVGLGGNVGKSFARQVALEPKACYVLEVSSFQLDDMYDFRADIAVLTNITPDHLDRYDYRFENYVASKFRIIRNQQPGDAFVYNLDDAATNAYLNPVRARLSQRLIPFTLHPERLPAGAEGAFADDNQFTIHINQNKFSMRITELALTGKHNLCNSMAAGITANLLNLRKDVIRESLEHFENAEHRLEFVANVHGVKFINDSKATNVNSAWFALESMDRPVIWIAGGTDKGNDYSELDELVAKKVKAIICLTKDSSKIRKAFGKTIGTIADTHSAEQAVRTAYNISTPGDVVLLSPACASFDLFENYEDRGRQFKAAVRGL